MTRLMDYLPRVYQGSAEVNALENALDPALAELWRTRDNLFLQLNVDTATWGLSAWEEALALERDADQPMENRRSRIRAKLRVRGVTTPEMLRGVTAPFSDGPVTVTEYPERYFFEIGLVLSLDRPAEDLPALWRQIAEARPAHLGFLLCASFPPAQVEEENAGRLRVFRLRAGIYERGNGIMRLDGAKRLDGTWVLDAAWGGGPWLERLRLSVRAQNCERAAAEARLSAWVGLEAFCRFDGLRLGAGVREPGAGRLRETGFTVRSRSGERVGGALTVDSMYYLDGTAYLDGGRKLNAAIIRSELL